MTLPPARRVDVSVLVPAKDEAENLPEFVRLCAEALRPARIHLRGRSWSNDGSPRRQRRRCCASSRAAIRFLRVVTHRAPARHRRRAPLGRRRGAGRRLRLLSRRPAVPARATSRAWWRRSSPARPTSSPAPSRASTRRRSSPAIYNRLCRWLFGVTRHRPQLGEGLPPRGHGRRAAAARLAPLHGGDRRGRWLPPRPRARCRSIPRAAGVSKFNWRRIPVGVLDLLSVWFQLRFGRKPMLFFGVAGAVLFLHRLPRRHRRPGAPLRLRHRLPAAAQPGRDDGHQRHRALRLRVRRRDDRRHAGGDPRARA